MVEDMAMEMMTAKCKLSDCDLPVWEGKDYCCKSHVLEDIQRRSARGDRKCGLPSCQIRVFIEGTREHNCCGWEHAKQAAALSLSLSSLSLNNAQVITQATHLEKTPLADEELVRCLDKFLQTKVVEKVKVITDFYEHHPWNTVSDSEWILTEADRWVSYAIVKLKWKNERRVNMTVDGYTWKRQGKTHPVNVKVSSTDDVQGNVPMIRAEKQHRTYKPEGEDFNFTMSEFTVQASKDWGVCKVIKNVVKEGRKKRKLSPSSVTDHPASGGDGGDVSVGRSETVCDSVFTEQASDTGGFRGLHREPEDVDIPDLPLPPGSEDDIHSFLPLELPPPSSIDDPHISGLTLSDDGDLLLQEMFEGIEEVF